MSIESILERIAISAERSELLLGKILDKLDDLPDLAISADRSELLLGKILDKLDDLPDLAAAADRSELLLGKILDKLDDLPDLAAAAEPASQEVPYVAVPNIPAPAPNIPAPAPNIPAPAPAAAFVPPPAPPAAAPTVPFTDQAGLIKYGMEKYRTLGAAKGGMIQNVIVDMGFNNLSKIPADRWAEFVSRCEAL